MNRLPMECVLRWLDDLDSIAHALGFFLRIASVRHSGLSWRLLLIGLAASLAAALNLA